MNILRLISLLAVSILLQMALAALGASLVVKFIVALLLGLVWGQLFPFVTKGGAPDDKL